VSRGRVIGHCTAERRRRLTRFMLNYDARRRHWPRGRWLYVSDLAVRPEGQGTGIGTLLLRRQLALARKLGCPAALTAKPGLVRYYRRFGFGIAKTIKAGTKVVYHVMTTRGVPLPSPVRKPLPGSS
jgi:GNAT superfamily N-acetyltransferase